MHPRPQQLLTTKAPMPSVFLKSLFAGTIFSSAFLLFLVQPLIAKQILPWFGGSAAVWSVCMVFFQVVLLAGYAYADWLTRRPVRTQAAVHCALLLCSLVFLPILTAAHWKPTGAEDPSVRILGLLLGTIGLPYFLLSTTGPLVQSWLARTPWGVQVYRYFSLSNLASLASLLAYPVLIEPYTALRLQALGWSWGYAGFVVMCGAASLYAAGLKRFVPITPANVAKEAPAKPSVGTYGLWLTLPALASWLLLAVTNHITQNVAAIPFLWVLPLSVYLLSFVFTFENDRWYRRNLLLPATAAALLLCAYGLQDGIGYGLTSGVPLYVIGLFILCMFLHGEMASMRPGHAYLTRFYLMLSLGGALGGITVGLVAPHVLPAYYELGIGLVLVAVLGAAVFRKQRARAGACLLLALACGYFLWLQVRDEQDGTRRMARNFYGTLSSLDSIDKDDPARSVRQLYHGSVKHGEQYLSADRRREATAYYGSTSGVGRALLSAPAAPRRVGLIGLGTGTLASYGRAGDVYRVYEINPQVFDFADAEFSFLKDSPARIERVLGDARLALEREPPQQFNVLAVDAFSGDSVPIHLITAEAMQVYLRHLLPEGIVAFHVTNRFLNLAPVVEKIALAQGLHTAFVHDEAEGSDLRRTDWILVSRSAQRLQVAPIHSASSAVPPIPGLRLWTDDFNNLFGVLK
jgi:SAM-dependent methyltransferase